MIKRLTTTLHLVLFGTAGVGRFNNEVSDKTQLGTGRDLVCILLDFTKLSLCINKELFANNLR